MLLQAGVRPTLLARHPARLDPRVTERADVVQADQADADAVVRAARDADALFWVAPDTADPDADPVAWYAQLGANAARAVTENGIARTVFLSSVGAEMRSGAGAIDGLARTENSSTPPAPRCCTCAAASSSRTCSLISPYCATAFVRVAAAVDYAQPWVDPRDIGDVAAARLLSGAWSGRHVQAVHGPEDLTLTQVADILTEALGRPIRAEALRRRPAPFPALGGLRREAGRGHGRHVGRDAPRLRPR